MSLNPFIDPTWELYKIINHYQFMKNLNNY